MFDDFILELLDTTVSLYSFSIENKNIVLGTILPLLWKDDFLSFTRHNDEISLFLSKKHDHLVRPIARSSLENDYKVLKVYQSNHQINESGIVSQFSKLFKDLDIPILYVNSFSHNYILIEEKDLHKISEYI